MPIPPPTRALDHLIRTLLPNDGAGDGELLGRFLERRDEAALAALVRRHGPMVWGTCRRLLNHHDAEDAFQAAFLVLVRKASSVVPREMVANFLYGVAHRTALQARRTAARRRAREVQMTAIPDAAAPHDPAPDEQPVLDEELSRLPDIYRNVIVLCELEGRTRKEVARQLGCPEGTVAGRLARARTMLAKRLARRGVTFPGGALAAAVAHNVASAGVPSLLISNTIGAATLVAAGHTATAGAISAEVAALTEGVLKAMFLSKLKATIAIVMVLGFLTTGASVFTYRAAAQGDKPVPAEEPMRAKPEPEKEPVTAWGKEVDGLQAGLGLAAGAKRAYRHGETVKLVVRVRNTGTETVKFECFYPYFTENPPAITDGGGKPFVIEKVTTFGRPVPQKMELAAGKEIELTELKFNLKPAAENGGDDRNYPGILKGTGKFHIRYEQLARDADSILGKLATGKLELEVKAEAEPPVPAAPAEVIITGFETNRAVTLKLFMVSMRKHHGDKNANAFREFIDPRYLKKHGLIDRDLVIPIPPVGSLYTIVPADDDQTFLAIVSTEADPKKKVREALLFRASVVGGKHYITPLKAPDPKTGAFTPWILRTRTDFE